MNSAKTEKITEEEEEEEEDGRGREEDSAEVNHKTTHRGWGTIRKTQVVHPLPSRIKAILRFHPCHFNWGGGRMAKCWINNLGNIMHECGRNKPQIKMATNTWDSEITIGEDEAGWADSTSKILQFLCPGASFVPKSWRKYDACITPK